MFNYPAASCTIAFLLMATAAHAVDEPAADARAMDRMAKISHTAVAILNRECIACHGPEKQEGHLRLDERRWLLSGGDNGPVLAEQPNSSALLERIEHSEPELKMPPKRSLSLEDIATLKSWVGSGAHWPEVTGPTRMAGPTGEALGNAWSDPNNPIRKLFDGKRLDLWSLKPIVRPATPEVRNPSWCSNPIDRFVLAGWERQGLVPADAATDHTLARRASMDLTGMPPAFGEVDTYVKDPSPEKYKTWIESRLNSPAFGVHWARLWLDAVRYSDSNGFDWDELRPDAWRYRDYVVRSMNRDLPFDQFIVQQLAGDELLAGQPRNADEQDCLIATGYLRLGPQDNAAGLFNEQDRARAELMSDLTETTGSAMLGLTLSCCRCHDHKTDPLSHEDHYRFRAFFAACQTPDKPSIELLEDSIRLQEHNDRLDAQIAKNKLAIDKIVESVTASQNGTIDRKKIQERFSPEDRQRFDALEAENKSLAKEKRPYMSALLMTDKSDFMKPTFVLAQGDHRSPKQQVEPGFPSVLFPNAPSIVQAKSKSTTGRRWTLANWIVSPTNPWTARVIVNRIWQNYFGTGIVATPNDFGVTGSPPSNPELLDFLASELIDSGWSLKHLHRLILTSACYRQQAVSRSETQSFKIVSIRDTLRRLSAEQMRDSLLKSSGLLQERAGGPPIWPELDAETLAANPAILDDNETKTKGWYPSPKSLQSVRSLFLIQKRTIRIPWLETFDLPENGISCGRRECSIVAPQSLSLMNGNLSAQAAYAIADSATLATQAGPRAIAVFVFETILQRRPTEHELSASLKFLADRSVAELSLVLFNSNEFAFIE